MFITKTAVKFTLTHEYKFVVILVNITAWYWHEFSPICVLNYIFQEIFHNLVKKNKTSVSDAITRPNIELIDVNSVTEQEMEPFPKEILESMWTNW